MKDLKITIITVCRNSEKYLEETICSVLGQTYLNIEYIVIDGNSTDNTVGIIQNYSARISCWISENDNGMYDAINKGLKLATGDYILILNSDDVLANTGVIENVANEISADRLDYYYGNIIKRKETGDRMVKLFKVNYKQLLFSTHGTFVPHPCFFIARKLNQALEGYSLSYRFASDYDYILRALRTPGARGRYLNMYITRFRIHDDSITSSGKIDLERRNILAHHGYHKETYLKKFFYYYLLWIRYKVVNLKNR